ncbi:hypothetical protein SOVF_038350, partial [Spinacia oleracea]
MAKPVEEKPGIEAINKLKSTDPPLFLSPSPDLSCFSRLASQHIFASLKPFSPKSPFDQLHLHGFDAEQIWQQIDLQCQPLITSLKREIKRYEKNPDKILDQFGVSGANGVLERRIKENGDVGLEDSEELSDEDEDEEGEDRESESEEEEDDDDNDESGEEEEELEDDGDGVPEVEDDFLKIKDLEKYLVREEEKEYGSEEKKSKKNKKKKGRKNVDGDEEDKNEESEEEEDDDELLMYGGDGEDGSDGSI